MSYQPGPKELAQRAMREQKAEANAKRNKPSPTELRQKVEAVRAKPPKPPKVPKRKVAP
jgi:hypothetical protein